MHTAESVTVGDKSFATQSQNITSPSNGQRGALQRLITDFLYPGIKDRDRDRMPYSPSNDHQALKLNIGYSNGITWDVTTPN